MVLNVAHRSGARPVWRQSGGLDGTMPIDLVMVMVMILVMVVVLVMVSIRAGKSKSLIRWKRLKGGKRRKKAEKANLIYD